jgi:transposase
LRELVGVYENNGPSWAKEMEQFLYKAHKYVELYRTEANLPVKYLVMLNKEYDEIVLKASCYYDEYRASKKLGKSLFIRLRDYKAEVLKFIHNFGVPFSNNTAEQDIRMCKVKQKISGCFRSTNGLLMFCRIRGYLVTARKQGINLFTAIENAISGNPFMLPKVKVQYNTT